MNNDYIHSIFRKSKPLQTKYYTPAQNSANGSCIAECVAVGFSSLYAIPRRCIFTLGAKDHLSYQSNSMAHIIEFSEKLLTKIAAIKCGLSMMMMQFIPKSLSVIIWMQVLKNNRTDVVYQSDSQLDHQNYRTSIISYGGQTPVYSIETNYPL
ncbi:hypothetical protein CEXT_305551 [Caerostris extrusa]|uniref:Uncharacterized protein n=1 Tax=Caerostris extrusa TaxID=172846 RepID=A0AAV4WYH0_CAEEX|nr:hypothetical protein CEXT_305551 [Caerostris extrusa]